MLPRQLERLRERLLKAGVAYRHVRRFVQELRDHYDDALRDELAKGLNRSAAEQAALTRIGNEEELANSLLARPELRSLSSRFPRLALGAAPILIWIGALALMVAAFDAAVSAPIDEASKLTVGYAMSIFSLRLLPVGLGIAVFAICVRQRLKPRWSILGTAVVAALSGTFSLSMTLPAVDQMGELGFSSSLLPFFFPHVAPFGRPDGAALAAGLLRGACMLAMSAVPYLLWYRHQHVQRTET